MSEYARVYHSIMDDPKFDGVREDMRLFGSWTMLLVVADMAYPSPAFIPPTVPRSAFARLVESGLVDQLPAHRFRIHGLVSERERRSQAARAGGLASGRSRSVEQPFNDGSTTKRTETNLAEQSKSKAEQEQEQGARDPADAYWSLTGRYPADKTLRWIDDLTEQYGAERLISTMAEGWQTSPMVSTFLGRVKDLLARDARQLSNADRATEKARIVELRRHNVPILRAQHNNGQHDEPVEGCPYCQEAA